MSRRRPSRLHRKRGDRMGRRAAHKIRSTVQYRRDQLLAKSLRQAVEREKRARERRVR